MSRPEPQGISRRSILRGAAVAGAAAAVSPLLNLSSAAAATAGNYTIRFDLDSAKKQTILGLGFEIQSDSINSGNAGTSNLVSAVPYDLTPSERARFYSQMLKGGRSDRGFRYCRLALGLYHRGLTPDRKRFIDRYPGQTDLLAEMVREAGIEGLGVEYWSPAPGWKSNNLLGNPNYGNPTLASRLASFEPAFLSQLGDAMVADLNYLTGPPENPRLRISWWGLQNEPYLDASYGGCVYSGNEYLQAFNAIAPKIKAAYPDVKIHATSHEGWEQQWGQALRGSTDALNHIDAWTYHRIGHDSNDQITTNYIPDPAVVGTAAVKPVFNNEFEYQSSQVTANAGENTLNTAQSIMNWMTFQNSPTWWWLHALKPTTNAESKGYSLGFWRPPHDTDFGPNHFPDLPVGHWTWNPRNWNAVAGFVKFMPWDSVRYHVDEPHPSDGVLNPLQNARFNPNQRIMAWKTPGGKPVIAITNRSATPYTYTIDTGTSATFRGYRYGPTTNQQGITNTNGTYGKSGPTLELTVPPMSIEFWVRD
ncbi:hypothetical protein ACWDRR_33770 [Kitasatospora sp. NPDC003701]